MQGNSRHGSSRAPSRAPSRGGAADAERIVSLLEPAVAAMGMDLENVKISAAGRRRLLRIVVDADGGVSLDDMALVSRELSATLDRAAAMGEAAYTLEVSSPGVDRPLTEPKHWRRAVGRLVSVPLRSQTESSATAPVATVTGRVVGADSSGVRIDVDGASREFGYSELGPGRIQIEFAPLDGYADDGADEEGPDGY
jgi:ribosome maturation factor RimP